MKTNYAEAEINGVFSSADLSLTGMYRYNLWRVWGRDLPMLAWIMLNPSTADAFSDDPTIRKCMGFARRGGFGGICVVNLFAFRATSPLDLKKELDPVGPHNDYYVIKAVECCHRTVLAWGTHGVHMGRNTAMKTLLEDTGLNDFTMTLATTKDGHPVHPLYQPYTRMPEGLAKTVSDAPIRT